MTTSLRARGSAVLVLPFVLLSLQAQALAIDNERPWAKGVAATQQESALSTFSAGNALFTESQYAAALARYREALRLWDHPAIHYNAAVSLINLDQPLAAYEHLEAALVYGEAPLGDDNYRQAMLYKKLLSAQLAELEVVCADLDAEVMLDGEKLFRAPGRATRRLVPGAYQLVAHKPGFLTESRALQLPSGKLTREILTLRAIGTTPMRTVRRWPAWKPWTLLGAGALVGLIGAAFIVDAKSNLDTFDGELAQLCPAGCRGEQLPSTVLAAGNRGRWENDVAIGLFAAGGAIAATGVVLLILNQPRLEADTSSSGLAVAPVVGAGTTGIAASLRF